MRRGKERKQNTSTEDDMGPTKNIDTSYTGEWKEREESDKGKNQSDGTYHSQIIGFTGPPPVESCREVEVTYRVKGGT